MQPNLVRDGVKIESRDLVEIVNIIFTKLQNAHGITKSLEQNTTILTSTECVCRTVSDKTLSEDYV